MIINILYCIAVLCGMILTWGMIDNSYEISRYITNKKQQIVKLNQFRKNSGISMYSVMNLIFRSLYTILKTKMIMNIQYYMDGLNVIKKDRNLFDIRLFIDGKFVRFMIRLKRGPDTVLHAIDEDGNDITDILGPHFNYDLCMITPKLMGSSKIEIITSNGESLTYNECDKIL